MKIDFFNAPKKNFEELTSRYFNSMIIIEEIFESKGVYFTVFQELLDILKYKFEDKSVRSKMITYKFHSKDKKKREIELRHLLSNMILWQPFLNMDKAHLISEEFLFDFNEFTSKNLLKYINEKLLPINDEDFYSKNAMIDDIYHGIIAIAHGFCMLIGNGISLHNIMTLENKYPEVREIMYKDIDESLTPKEIEDDLSDRTKRLIDIINNDMSDENGIDSDFKALYKAGAGIKPAQLQEFMIKIGLKADLNGNIIPVINNGSFLVNGLPTPDLIYINALSGRKALINVKRGMGIPGAYAKKLSQISTSSGILSKDTDMCDSVATVDYIIRDDNFLSLLHGRYYYDDYGNLKHLDYNRDKHLIGRQVRFKSPATCCGKDGICKYCYGDLYDINSSLFSAGSLAALKSSEPAQQGVLSTKHNQRTDSVELAFSEGFDNVFEIDSSSILVKEDSNLDSDIYIELDEIHEDVLDDKTFYYVYGFKVLDSDQELLYHITEENESKLYLCDSIISMIKTKKNSNPLISLELLDDEAELFNIEVKSKEMMEPIKIFNKILNTKTHGGATNVSELCQLFAEALIDMGLPYHLTHYEVLIRAFVRKKSNILEYPDFTMKGDPNDYRLVRLDEGLQYHPSAMISLPYGYLKKQLVSTELYNKRSASHLDPLYASRLADYL